MNTAVAYAVRMRTVFGELRFNTVKINYLLDKGSPLIMHRTIGLTGY